MSMRANGRIVAAALAVGCALVGGVSASAAGPAATRVLHFPQDQYVGTLCLDPSLVIVNWGQNRDPSLPYGLDPRRLDLNYDWSFLGFAQGDAVVPAGRNVVLNVMLRLRKEDARGLARLPPRQYQTFGIDRCRADPLDLSGLSALDLNDLYDLHVCSLVPQADADQRVLQPIRHLTGLKVLRLSGTGVTDKGLEYLKDLHSLRALELGGESSVGNQGLAGMALP